MTTHARHQIMGYLQSLFAGCGATAEGHLGLRRFLVRTSTRKILEAAERLYLRIPCLLIFRKVSRRGLRAAGWPGTVRADLPDRACHLSNHLLTVSQESF